MNKLHTYLLPISVGSFGLLWTPISENTTVAYGLLVFAVIIGIFGLQSLTKQYELANASQQEVLKAIEEIVKGSKNEVVNKLQNQIEVLEESTAGLAQEIKQIPSGIVSQIEKMESTLATSIANNQEVSKKSVTLLEEKVDEGNKVLENVSILIIQELKSIVQLTDELVSLQNTMPNELSMLQDVITSNQQDAFDTIRNIEMSLEKLAGVQDIVEAHLETSSTTHEQVVSKITDEFTAISANLASTTSTILDQFMNSNEKIQGQLKTAATMLEKLELYQSELGKLNEHSVATVSAQLRELSNLTKSLVAGISQVADSKSAERQQLLKIQKDLIKKYS